MPGHACNGILAIERTQLLHGALQSYEMHMTPTAVDGGVESVVL